MSPLCFKTRSVEHVYVYSRVDIIFRRFSQLQKSTLRVSACYLSFLSSDQTISSFEIISLLSVSRYLRRVSLSESSLREYQYQYKCHDGAAWILDREARTKDAGADGEARTVIHQVFSRCAKLLIIREVFVFDGCLNNLPGIKKYPSRNI